MNTTSAHARPGIELSIVVPTFNEHGNVIEIVKRLDAVLRDVCWEVIFVDDDSPDGTAELVRRIAQRDRRIRCLQRIKRRGLSSACIEGLLSSSAPYLAVMDGDLQHDEKLLPQMLTSLKNNDIDIVIGSRYREGGSVASWHHRRVAISRLSTRLSKLVLRAELTDPMSGFFIIRRSAFAEVVRRTSGIGFKVLLDLFASSPRALRFKEIPYRFRHRHTGRSKLDGKAAWEYGMLILDKLTGRFVPVRFMSFSLIGGSGVLIHFLILTLMFKAIRLDFVTSQVIATLVAMVFNFSFNNLITYRDMRLKGRQWFQGLVSFSLVCSMGAVANVGIASFLFDRETKWFLAALAGILVGAVWNYAVTLVYVWGKH